MKVRWTVSPKILSRKFLIFREKIGCENPIDEHEKYGEEWGTHKQLGI